MQKTRMNMNLGEIRALLKKYNQEQLLNGYEKLDERKQKHIWNATRYYIYSHKLEDQYIRIDVIEIYKRKNRFYLHHIKQIK